ncbi:MAG TPA: hypothetical protein DIU15_00730 [Deltaproteobacteria bacterium]|nr:hypothetical protein [Deltaproteobacteria bacterium]HCP44553.1 hypothetical protein [Deltaproteobacteria bacterium]
MTAVYPSPRLLNILVAAAMTLILVCPAPAEARRRQDFSGKGFSGENNIGVHRAEFRAAQEGMELLYQRRYLESLQVFEVAGIDFPDSPLGPVGRAIVYQAMMLENYDYSWDRAYMTEYGEAKDRMRVALRSDQYKAWNYFLAAIHLGIDAMYQVRKSEYLSAFNKAWDALEYIKKVERVAPQFVDVQLGLGLYNYWRTAITEKASYLPSFGDHRAEGLEQMRLAKDKGLLASAPAAIALSYSYMEQRNWSSALAEGAWANRLYPNNIINQMTIGRVHRMKKDWPAALAIFERILEIDPENKRVWFHIGETHYKSRRNNTEAKKAYNRYMETQPHAEYLAHTYYRLGLIERRRRHYDAAIDLLKKAVTTWPKFKPAGARLDQVKKEKERRSSGQAPPPRVEHQAQRRPS